MDVYETLKRSSRQQVKSICELLMLNANIATVLNLLLTAKCICAGAGRVVLNTQVPHIDIHGAPTFCAESALTDCVNISVHVVL